MSIEVILREHVEHLGRRGEVVKVADGYARNYLLPRRLALAVTGENKRLIERERAKAEAREAEDVMEAQALQTRLEAEYEVPITFEAAPYVTARWCACDDKAVMERFLNTKRASLAEDRDGNPVFLARNSWDLGRVQEDFPKLRLTATKERH